MHVLVILLFVGISALLSAFPVHAVSVTPPTDFRSLLGLLSGIINLIIPIIFALTFIAITWGVIRAWIMGDASDADIDQGKKVVLVGVIALTIMLSIWGILRLLQASIFG
jgi:hypothetical protein